MPAQVCGALERAVDAAFRDAKAAGEPGAVILLSPACASQDQFKDYEHRGDIFRSLVQDRLPASLKVTA